jgi:hypothetical protein
MMTINQMRKALKDRGFRVKLSRRNGVRAAVEVMVFLGERFDYRCVSGQGNTDLEAFLNAIDNVSIETGMEFV